MFRWSVIWRDERVRRGLALIAQISCTAWVAEERIGAAGDVCHACRRTEAAAPRKAGIAEIAACAVCRIVMWSAWDVLHIHGAVETIVTLVLAQYSPAEKKNHK